MAQQVPRQLAVFNDPARALKRADRTLGHVEQRPWGALATVPSTGGKWTVGAFLGKPSKTARVASGYAERRILNYPAGDWPIAALVSLASLGVASMFVPPTALVLFALLGLFAGLPLAHGYRMLEARSVPSVELDDDLRLFVADEREGWLPGETVGRLLRAAGRGDRPVLVAAARRTHEVLLLARECPADMGIRPAVDALLVDLAADPARVWPATSDALDELLEAVQLWRRSREELLARADEPVVSRRRRDAEAEEVRRRERARSAVQGVVEQLRSDAEVQREASDEV